MGKYLAVYFFSPYNNLHAKVGSSSIWHCGTFHLVFIWDLYKKFKISKNLMLDIKFGSLIYYYLSYIPRLDSKLNQMSCPKCFLKTWQHNIFSKGNLAQIYCFCSQRGTLKNLKKIVNIRILLRYWGSNFVNMKLFNPDFVSLYLIYGLELLFSCFIRQCT